MDAITKGPAIDAARLWGDIMALAEITEPDRPYTRRSFSERFLAGRAWLAERYRSAGLSVGIDAGGNLIGRRPGRDSAAPVIMMGSHSDTVTNGGRFDGIAGVLCALEIARALADNDTALEHALEVVDFLAEEPSEYGLSCIGSRAISGALDPGQLAFVGPGGETLAAAIGRVGGSPAQLDAARRSDICAFLELHIEQGPVLESAGIDIGVVTAIVGITRIEIVLAGEPAHAGTAPMAIRRDAGVAAAAVVLKVRDIALDLSTRGDGYFVATVGVVEIQPGAANVVPGGARLVIDARCERASQMQCFLEELRKQAEAIAQTGNIAVSRFAILSHNDPASCDPGLRAVLEQSAAAVNCTHRSMASGAGHDAAFVSRVAPAAMLFVPCLGGRSHCPEEWTEKDDLAAGAQVMLEAVCRIDRSPLVRKLGRSSR